MNFIVLLLTQLLSNLPGVMGDYFKKQGDLVNADLEYKRKFINTCDAMIHSRSEGESFGAAIA